MGGMRSLLAALVAFSVVSLPCAALSAENVILNRLFNRYDDSLRVFIGHIAAGEWEQATSVAEDLAQQVEEMRVMAEGEGNLTWAFYASNLHHHGLELTDASQRHDMAGVIYLVSTLLHHMEQIQSVHPRWLRERVAEQMYVLEQGIAAKDVAKVRDAAEIIHVSSSKILLSASSARDVYKHTDWQHNIVIMNRLGDAILGEVNQGDWSKSSEHLTHIRHLVNRWEEGFK